MWLPSHFYFSFADVFSHWEVPLFFQIPFSATGVPTVSFSTYIGIFLSLVVNKQLSSIGDAPRLFGKFHPFGPHDFMLFPLMLVPVSEGFPVHMEHSPWLPGTFPFLSESPPNFPFCCPGYLDTSPYLLESFIFGSVVVLGVGEVVTEGIPYFTGLNFNTVTRFGVCGDPNGLPGFLLVPLLREANFRIGTVTFNFFSFARSRRSLGK